MKQRKEKWGKEKDKEKDKEGDKENDKEIEQSERKMQKCNQNYFSI